MIIPIYKSIQFHQKFLIERSLPSKGKIMSVEGTNINPWDRLGFCRTSNKEIIIPKDYKIQKKFFGKNFVKSGELIGRKKNNYLFSTFDGFIQNRGPVNVVISYPQDVFKVSGVFGKVVNVASSNSVLIETSGYELKFVATSTSSTEGQIVVLPNPSEILQVEFLNKYVKEGIGSIIYIGDYLRLEVLNKAIEIGCSGVICGSCDREVLNYAKENNFFVGLLSGFGRIPTHSKTYSLLKSKDRQFGIVQEESNSIFISVNVEDLSEVSIELNTQSFLNTSKGLNVIVIDYPFYGWEGEVVEISDTEILVRLVANGEVIKTNIFGIIALP
jgi:hypothetical protein